MPVDLHLHSTRSDGTLSPADLITEARRLGLSAVALTDHNTVAGLPAFLAEAQRQGITAVAGTELSTIYEGTEYHLLGLFIPENAFPAVTALTEDYLALKEQSNRDLVARLTAAGYSIDYDEILRKHPHSTINRARIAEELLASGHVASVKEAFSTLLGVNMGYYVPPRRLDLLEAIRFLRGIRAIPVWAHPLQSGDEATVRAILPAAVEAGLMGLEVQHSSYDEATMARAKSIADDFGLLYSGGSDYHGIAKPDVRMGVGKGNLCIPDSYYEDLRARAL